MTDKQFTGPDYVAAVVAEACITLAYFMQKDAIKTNDARVEMIAIAGQESNFTFRRQSHGPARGLWQFELGSETKGGGVCGVYRHLATKYLVKEICSWQNIKFDPTSIYHALEFDDLLAAYIARLLLWTDPHPMPDGAADGWETYLACWRPGKPRKNKWNSIYRLAKKADAKSIILLTEVKPAPTDVPIV